MTTHDKRQAGILSDVDAYYTKKVKTHGATPRGVDWNSAESQHLRFSQLSGLLPAGGFSVCDYGCGYGSYYDHLARDRMDFRYVGVDVSAEMIRQARNLHADAAGAVFECAREPVEADHVVASGIFNVRQHVGDAEWLDYILGCIDTMAKASCKGFAFNCLTSYSDRDRMRADLYYADPKVLFDHCMRISRHVTLLHGYGLYEFTILVRKEEAR
jgi:SAM-dependent methyltransferase